ncbi:hypothetical protein EZV62_001001 [Acer yangbiense]|uniref:DUF659 domain-containing protein n=1 Tax=Acer yangbiense TaxID=1000413 RepID=A0A5C7IV59_9ROSI|nr:hypothetical protein EZV62_001001 [Acer yangbiense]
MNPQAEVVSSKANESEKATPIETKEDKSGGINASTFISFPALLSPFRSLIQASLLIFQVPRDQGSIPKGRLLHPELKNFKFLFIIQVNNNVTHCRQVPELVKEEIISYMLKKKHEKEKRNLTANYDDNSIGIGVSDDDDDLAMIYGWMYDAGIPFNAMKYPSFKPFCEAVGQYGPGVTPPSYHEVRVPLLKKDVELTCEAMKVHEDEWKAYGCSILSDGWKDRRERTFINFLVNSPRESVSVDYIYGRTGVVNMLMKYTNMKELLRPAKTRFATAFITLSRIHSQKTNLRKMFTSNEWAQKQWAKEAAAKKVVEVILVPSFWNNIVFALKIVGPLVKVLQLVDSERKPPMGYIYEAMDRAKEAIAKSFGGNESKYGDIFKLIDAR